MERTLYLVPQYPSKMRYSSWFFTEFPKELRKRFNHVVVLGEKYWETHAVENNERGMFSAVNDSIKFEMHQIAEYLTLDIKHEDIMLLLDLSFPGFFTNVLYHKRPLNCFAYCHATSKNHLDYFEKCRGSKSLVEYGHSKLFRKVFVGSEYHRQKLGWRNGDVIGLPLPPLETFTHEQKPHNIVSVARQCEQKVTKEIENEVEMVFGPIKRRQFDSWDGYYRFLGRSKILLITSKEDTFNYSILEAVLNGCIPVAPNNLCFPELLPREYLFDNTDDLIDRVIPKCLNGTYKVPVLLNMDSITHFYTTLCDKILEEPEMVNLFAQHFSVGPGNFPHALSGI